MTLKLALSLGLALIAVGYLITQFVVLVLDDLATDHEAAEGPAYDAQTVAWLRSLREDDLPVADVDIPVHTDIVDDDWLELLVTRPADGPTS